MIPGKGTQITLFQYILIIHSVQLGIGLIPLPGDLARGCGTDGWIVLIIGWLISMISSLIIIQIMRYHPNGTIIDLLRHYFGKWVGKVGMVMFVGYFLLYIFLIYNRMGLLVQNWIMQQTNVSILMLLFLLPAYMIARGGFRIIGRYSEIILFLSIGLILTSLYLFKHAQWIHLLPILKHGWIPILQTLRTNILSFVGFEIAFFLYPYLEKKSSASLGILIANSTSFFVYMLFTLLAFVNFSPDEITQYHNTLISLFKILEFRFLERFDILILSIYLLIIIRTFLPVLYAAVICTQQLGLKGQPRLHILLILTLMVGVTWVWKPGWNDSMRLRDVVQNIGIGIAFVLPPLLWVILIGMRRLRRSSP
ncbi:endospore germination permease [Paenibacillus qinlingensis]|uniref:Spore germination protein (Amino acid permease) n=1 Tax=Paenibacillus qinlingensis TaxID=1837343 RepID=A0ABU1P597_9BACL|nr:endospore germination permease [Paenibacillus qinlingensis]MDR6554744.1 spore germination protein (amino acid permease) [Paenibacillus qinlingensis]